MVDHTDADLSTSDVNSYYFNISSDCIEEISNDTAESIQNTHTIQESDNCSSIVDAIRMWALTNSNVSHASINSLLRILYSFHLELPLDVRTLFKTSSLKFNIKELKNGQFIYLGIENALKTHLFKNSNFSEDIIKLIINVDGLCLFKSSSINLWSILGMVQNSVRKPFVIGIFCGISKPQPLSNFLDDFITELSHLLTNGFQLAEKHYKVQIYSFVCDAPARSYLKCAKSHGD